MQLLPTSPLALLLLAAPLASAGAPPLDAPSARDEVLDLSAELETVRAETRVPGLVVLALQDGEVAASGAAGVRVQGGAEALRLDDPVHLGSCTKAMTATVCATLVEDGLLAWDTTLAEALPELAARVDPGFAGVTLLQLLRHQAGIAERRRPQVAELFGQIDGLPGTPSEVRLAILARVLSLPPSFPAAGSYDYSNFGYLAAAAMAERRAGSPWEELIVERLFEPLGMTTAGVGSPAGEHVPVGHAWEDDAWRPLPPGPRGALPAAVGPAGLVHASLRDWARFVADQLAGERGDGALLPRASYELLHDDPGSGYAAGWGLTTHLWSWGQGRALAHTGSDGTWYSLVFALPEWDLVVLSAADCGEPGGGAATERARELVLGALGFE